MDISCIPKWQLTSSKKLLTPLSFHAVRTKITKAILKLGGWLGISLIPHLHISWMLMPFWKYKQISYLQLMQSQLTDDYDFPFLILDLSINKAMIWFREQRTVEGDNCHNSKLFPNIKDLKCVPVFVIIFKCLECCWSKISTKAVTKILWMPFWAAYPVNKKALIKLLHFDAKSGQQGMIRILSSWHQYQ